MKYVDYRIRRGAGGIYMVRHRPSGEFYIGASSNLGAREYTHYTGLKNRNSGHRLLLKKFTPFRKRDFEFVKLESCPNCRLGERERYWKRKLLPSLNSEPETVRLRAHLV